MQPIANLNRAKNIISLLLGEKDHKIGLFFTKR